MIEPVDTQDFTAQPERRKPEQFEHVKFRIEAGVAKMTLNRPEHNLLNEAMLREIAGGITHAGERDDVTVELPLDVEEFLSWLAAERGRSRNTIAAYRRDLGAYWTWLRVQHVDLLAVTPATIEGLFASDLAFLQDLYRRVNGEGHTQVAVTCPACKHDFAVDIAGGGAA